MKTAGRENQKRYTTLRSVPNSRNGRPEQSCSTGRAGRQENFRPQVKCFFLTYFYRTNRELAAAAIPSPYGAPFGRPSIPEAGGRRFEPCHVHHFSRLPHNGFLRQRGGILQPPHKFRCVKLKGTRTHGELPWNGLRLVRRIHPLFLKGWFLFKMARIEETNQLGS
jgi:hypothetical protein